MPENEFEKKVSSEMQELKFKPSEAVWLRVEERIRRKKKRRVFIIIFLLAGLALLGYWQWDNFFGGKKNEIANVVPKTPSGEKLNERSSPTSNEINNTPANNQTSEPIKQEEIKNPNDRTISDKTTTDQPIADKKDNIVPKNEIIKQRHNKKDETKIKPVTVKNKKVENPEVSVDIVSPNSQKRNNVTDGAKVKDPVVVKTIADTIIQQKEIKQPEVLPQGNKNVQSTPVRDSIKIDVVDKKKDTTGKKDTVLKAEPVLPAPIAKKDTTEKKWKWGLHLTPGISSLNDISISLFSELKSADALNYQGPPQTGSGTGGVPVRQKPSEVKAGFAFQAGAFVQRQLSKRTSLSLGLQYGYYSNVIGVGNHRDSLLNNNLFSSVLDGNDDHIYNAGGDTVKFTNRYHFIELPLRFQWRLNKSKTNPFVWSTGFTIGQLIANNALMYDTAFNGIYYKNNKWLNKTQFSLSTGFSWTIANGKKAQWSLGPVANIHLNRLVDSPFENKGSVFFAGLRTSILFNEKK